MPICPEAARQLKKWPDKIPVIVKKQPSSRVQDLEHNKIMLPADFTMGQFVFLIRRKIQLDSTEALFIFVNETIAAPHKTLSEIYRQHKADDGYLYCTYTSENTFGSEDSLLIYSIWTCNSYGACANMFIFRKTKICTISRYFCCFTIYTNKQDNIMNVINHSLNPNCEIVKEYGKYNLYSIRDINTSEQLTINCDDIPW